MHNKAYGAELNTGFCHLSRKVQRGVSESMMHLMRVEMRQKGTAGRQRKHDASDESGDKAETLLPAAVAIGVILQLVKAW